MGNHVTVVGLMLLAGGWATAHAVFDPMQPPASLSQTAVNAPAVESQLSWIRNDNRRPVAWYGGRVVGVGDQVDGVRIQAIRDDHIVVTSQQGRQMIWLLGTRIVKSTAVSVAPTKRIR